MRGRAVPAGEPASLLAAGARPQLLHLQRQLLAGEIRTEALGTGPIHALPPILLARGGADDLPVARVARPLAGWIFGRRFLRVPDFVDVWIDLRHREQVW